MRFLTFEAISDKIRCKFFERKERYEDSEISAGFLLCFSGSLHNRLFPPGKNICGESDQKDLDLLKNLDSETTMKYISYQELFPDSDDNTELSDDIKEVFSLFFQNFDYKILDISIDQDQETASAHLRLTTLDSQAL